MAKNPNIDRKALGSMLRAELKQKKKSQKELGTAIEKSQAWVSRVLRGDAKRLPAYQLVATYLLPDAPEDWMEQVGAPKRKKSAPQAPQAPQTPQAPEEAPVLAEAAPAVAVVAVEPPTDETSQRIDALATSVSNLTTLVRQLLSSKGASSSETSIAGTNTLPSGDVLVFRGDGQVFVVSHEDGNVYKAKGLELPTQDISSAWPTRDVSWKS